MLERLGYRVTPCTDSLTALKLFEEDPDAFHLVITDMTMPHMTGARLAQKLKAVRPGIRIILCTGFSELMDEEKAAAYGIEGFILKPVVKSEIGAKIQEVLKTET